MDQEQIDELLGRLSRHVKEVGFAIAFDTNTVEDLKKLSKALENDKKALDMYIEIIENENS